MLSSRISLRAIVLLLSAISASAQRFDPDDLQYAKSVKGGRGGAFKYNAEANFDRFFGNDTRFRTFNGQNTQLRQALSPPTPTPLDESVGVCYIEVPTADLVLELTRVPIGNGSRPDLSRIRTCCKGYERNIHNYRLCDPVCKDECINAICTAPDVCTCYPDHVRNLTGHCVATCPIGCQNGRCSGNECICNDGYRLHSDRNYCLPMCKNDCSGLGRCILPDVCECKPGYAAGEFGTCAPVCGRCEGGECVAPGQCRCRQGYKSDHMGSCTPVCASDCPPGKCLRPNVCESPTPDSGLAVSREPFIPNQSLYNFRNQQNAPRNQYNSQNQGSQTNETDRWRELQYPTVVVNQQSLYPSLQTSNLEAGCRFPCVNGACQGGRCQCNPGYIVDAADPTASRCLPHCPGGCVNGICSSPHFCICNMGYVKDHSVKGRPACVKRVKRSVGRFH